MLFNKKADSDFASWNVIYIILTILLISILFLFVASFRGNAKLWEDFYAKEIVRVIDSGNVGDDVFIDITKATDIANKNNKDFNSIFSFSNLDNSVKVSLSGGSATSFNFFNDVDVEYVGLEVPSAVDAETNRLHFRIVEKNE